MGSQVGQAPAQIDQSLRGKTSARMRAVLADIKSGRFVRGWMTECAAGQPSFKAIRRNNDAHQIDAGGERLRAMMPWITEKPMMDKSRN